MEGPTYIKTKTSEGVKLLGEPSREISSAVERPPDTGKVVGSTPTSPTILSPIELAQFWSQVKVGRDFECWPWQGRTNDKGYGRFAGTMAHRIACALINGPVADDDLVRHSCDNPPCCNPKHLSPGSHQDNMDDAIKRARTARGRGHGMSKLTPEQVAHIHQNPDKLTGVSLAALFDVSEATISYVRNRRSWKYG